MEAFSLLKYWRTTSSSTTTTPIITTSSPSSSTSSSDNDEGPYFDLEFSLPEENEPDLETSIPPKSIDKLITETETETETDSEEEEVEGEEGEGVQEKRVNLSISSSTSLYDSSKEHLVSDETLFFNGDSTTSLSVSSTDSTPKLRNNLFKSASKFRVLMALKLKKLKENGVEEGKKEGGKGETVQENDKKFFTVKFINVEEAPSPPVSLLSSSKSETRKEEKGSSEKLNEKDEEEKKFTRDMMQRYLKMMKPLYVRASKRYGEKMRFSGQLMGLSASTPSPPEEVVDPAVGGGGEVVENGKGGVKSLKERNFAAGLRVVRRHLVKSKSAAAAVSTEAQPVSKRRDDTLIEQQDGIQSAIMHCKRSFNFSRESSGLQRSSSHQQAAKVVALSTEEQVVCLGGQKYNYPFSGV